MALALRLTIEKTEPVRRGNEHFWKVVRVLGADGRTFGRAAIVELSEEPHAASVNSFLTRLERAGLIAKAGKAKAPSGRPEMKWRLCKSPEKLPLIANDGTVSRVLSANQQMWNIMRGASGRSGFCYLDLVVLGSTEDQPVAGATAKRFIQALAAAGYLNQLDPGGPGRPALWRLRQARNTGPLPPMILRAKIIYDQNHGRVLSQVLAEQEQEA